MYALQELCAGFELLEETLVLRLEGGAEHYIPVGGRYASHAFGAPLEQLSARHGSQVQRCWQPSLPWQNSLSLLLIRWAFFFMSYIFASMLSCWI